MPSFRPSNALHRTEHTQSPLPLSALSSKVCTALEETHGMNWPAELVGAKIKLIAKRKAHFDESLFSSRINDDGTSFSTTTPTTTTAAASSKVLDLFEDTDMDRLWRWEITTLELLPSECAANARRARSARKKVSSNYSAIVRLIKSLDEAEKLIFDPKLPILDESIAKISRDEEKILRFEREAEKTRLAEEAKTRKLQELEAKKKAKEEEAEEKRRLKEEAAEQKKRQKEEIERSREDAKRQKESEKEQKDAELKAKEHQKLMSLTKQKGLFISFFAAPKATVEKEKAEIVSPVVAPTVDNMHSFDVHVFRSMINASRSVFSSSFARLSDSAIRSRKRRTKKASVSIYTTAAPVEDAWDAQPYAELQTISIPNKYRFLSFHEDCRPAYHGTWSKHSTKITGKTPFAKETSVVDYDYDSEAEWEEGDDEIGEDVEDETKNQEEEDDEEGNAKMYDFNDGFCVADEQFLDNEEEADEETKALYKKKLQANDQQDHLHSTRIRIIAPGHGGVPLIYSSRQTAGAVEGYDENEVRDILRSYKSITLLDARLCMDAFPQLNWDDESPPEVPESNVNVNKDEYTLEETIAFARYVHHSTVNSKEKLVEELRNSNPSLFSIRAKATRKLDTLAVKKKHPKTPGLWYWEVRREFLEELGLTDLLVSYDVWLSTGTLPQLSMFSQTRFCLLFPLDKETRWG